LEVKNKTFNIMIKKTTRPSYILTFIFVASFLFPVSASAANPVLSLQASKTSLNLNEQFTVNVLVDTKDMTVTATELHINFSSNLQPISVSAGAFLTQVLIAGTTTASNTSITLGCPPTSPKKGQGTLATITVKTIQGGSGQISFGTNTGIAALESVGNVLAASAPITVAIASNPDAPVVGSFSASPASISLGAPSTLSWAVTGATNISIDNNVGTVSASGTKTVSPTQTTTYVLTATNSSGSVGAGATVQVAGSLPPPVVSTHPDGALINHNGTLYVIEYGQKRGFTSMSAFKGLGYKLQNVTIADLSGLSEGPVIANSDLRHPRGTLINDKGTIYFLGADLRYPFPSAEVFLSWGNRWQNIVAANNFDLQMPLGPVAQMK